MVGIQSVDDKMRVLKLRFWTSGDERAGHTGNYHNPTRQRGIFPHTASNAKAQSLADAAGWDSRKLATSKAAGVGA
jgi:hypothetical protein